MAEFLLEHVIQPGLAWVLAYPLEAGLFLAVALIYGVVFLAGALTQAGDAG